MIEQIFEVCKELWLESEFDSPEWYFSKQILEITRRYLKYKKGFKE